MTAMTKGSESVLMKTKAIISDVDDSNDERVVELGDEDKGDHQ